MVTVRTFVLGLAKSSLVVSHSFVTEIVIDGLSYAGFYPVPEVNNSAALIAWSTTADDQGYVNQTSYSSSDIICHHGAQNARGHASVAAGEQVYLQWRGWPQSHKGPVMDYLAPCGSSCETVNKSSLEWFKINEVGLVDPTQQAPIGLWGSDELIANNNSWIVEIPPSIRPGFYVLRHEIIALHNATFSDGAQNYPQSFNLEVTGNGTISPSGVKELYGASDPGILLNITAGLDNYVIPGPTLIKEAVSVSLSIPVQTGIGVPVTGRAHGTAVSSGTKAASATSTQAAVP